MTDETSPSLTVVVIGRNEGPRLRRCLESVRSMNYADSAFQLIYVDSASADDSIAIARSFAADTFVIDSSRPCAARARNTGWRSALAPFVLFLDGDTILDPDFIAGALPAFEDPRVAVVSGRRREIHPEQSIYTAVLDLDWVSPQAGESRYCGGDAVFRRSILGQTGGFDEELIAGEEPELCWRIRARGSTVVLLDIPMTGHDLAMTRWRQYWRRSVRTGHAYAEISERFKTTGDPLWLSERTRNAIQGTAYSTLIAGALLIGIAWLSPWPVLVALALVFALTARTALRNRNRAASARLLWAYAFHSHLQQIPILAGQVEYWLNRFRGRRRALIEYQNKST